MENENEAETSLATKTYLKEPPKEPPIKALTAEIKKRLPKFQAAGDQAVEKMNLGVEIGIRIGWLLNDAKQQLKGTSVTFREWVLSNFDQWSVEGAERCLRVAKEYQVDLEHSALRDKFGLEPLLLDTVSGDSLKKQINDKARKQAFVADLKGLQFLPGKADAKPETRETKTPHQKLLRSLTAARDRYFKYKADTELADWDNEFFDTLIDLFLSFHNEYGFLVNMRPDAPKQELIKEEHGAPKTEPEPEQDRESDSGTEG